jgi:hypothetical protein
MDQSYWLAIFLQALYLRDLDHAVVQAKFNNNNTIHQGATKYYNRVQLKLQLLNALGTVDPNVKPFLPGLYTQLDLAIPQSSQNRLHFRQVTREIFPNDVCMADEG